MQQPQQRKAILDRLLKRSLTVLDSWQEEVKNIRLMHHEIWKESRVYQVIRQHRAGSRVERQTRILPRGQRTDVDYKFEVVGVKVDGAGSRNGMYWVPTPDSPAYGKVHGTPEYRYHILESENYRDIFSEDTFRLLGDDTYLLLPEVFKENVVNISGFAYARKEVDTKKSPSRRWRYERIWHRAMFTAVLLARFNESLVSKRESWCSFESVLEADDTRVSAFHCSDRKSVVCGIWRGISSLVFVDRSRDVPQHACVCTPTVWHNKIRIQSNIWTNRLSRFISHQDAVPLAVGADERRWSEFRLSRGVRSSYVSRHAQGSEGKGHPTFLCRKQ